MWIYIFSRFPLYSKSGRKEHQAFCRELQKYGFHRLHPDLHIRYCTTLNNAMGHKRKITEKIFEHSQISIIFVADKQQNYSYHHWGSQRIKKANDKILKPLEMVEFI